MPEKRPILISVDLQRDFTRPEGAEYAPRECVPFIIDYMVPYLRSKGVYVREIVSDYRQPRQGDDRDICRPGEVGFLSEIDSAIVKGRRWIKSQNSPVWTREGAGDPEDPPGLPYPNPAGFDAWLRDWVGGPDEVTVYLFGLTLDRCLLATAQELRFRGYDVIIIEEATDTSSGSHAEKMAILRNPPLTHWAGSIKWSQLKKVL